MENAGKPDVRPPEPGADPFASLSVRRSVHVRGLTGKYVAVVMDLHASVALGADHGRDHIRRTATVGPVHTSATFRARLDDGPPLHSRNSHGWSMPACRTMAVRVLPECLAGGTGAGQRPLRPVVWSAPGPLSRTATRNPTWTWRAGLTAPLAEALGAVGLDLLRDRAVPESLGSLPRGDAVPGNIRPATTCRIARRTRPLDPAAPD